MPAYAVMSSLPQDVLKLESNITLYRSIITTDDISLNWYTNSGHDNDDNHIDSSRREFDSMPLPAYYEECLAKHNQQHVQSQQYAQDASLKNFLKGTATTFISSISNSIMRMGHTLASEITYVPPISSRYSSIPSNLNIQNDNDTQLSKSSYHRIVPAGLLLTRQVLNYMYQRPLQSIVIGLGLQATAAAAFGDISSIGNQNQYYEQDRFSLRTSSVNQLQTYKSNSLNGSYQFVINQDTKSEQIFSALAILNDGNAFVVWKGSQAGNNDVYGRIFSPNGTALTQEMMLNQVNISSQSDVKITGLDNGNAFVTWQGLQTGTFQVYGRIFDSNGTALTDDMLLNQNTTLGQVSPSLATLSNGNVFTVWAPYIANTQIYGRIFDSNGIALTNVSILETQLKIGDPLIVALNNGNAFAVWEGYQTGLFQIYGKTFNSNGIAITNTTTIGQNPSIDLFPTGLTVLSNDNVFITWYSHSDVYGQLFADNGTALTASIRLNQNTIMNADPVATTFNNSYIFVAWSGVEGSTYNSQGRSLNIYGRIFNSNDIALGGDTILSQTISKVSPLNSVFPQVKTLGNGDIFLTWTGTTYARSDQSDIYGLILTADNLNSMINVSTITTSPLTSHSLTTAALTSARITSSSLSTQAITTQRITTAALTTNDITTALLTTNPLITQTIPLITTDSLTTQSQVDAASSEKLTLGNKIAIGVLVPVTCVITAGTASIIAYLKYRAHKFKLYNPVETELQAI